MSTQISLRLPDNLLDSAKSYAKSNGFGNLQDFIKETIREKIYDEELNNDEVSLIKKFLEKNKTRNIYGNKEALHKKLNK